MAGFQPARSRAGNDDRTEDRVAREIAAARRVARDAKSPGARNQAAHDASRRDDVARLLTRIRQRPERSSPPDGTAWGTARAVANGVFDSLPFGLSNGAGAGIRALGDAVDGGDFRISYRNRLARAEAQDRLDEARHGTARAIGKWVGTGLQLAATGGVGGLIARGDRIVQAMPLIGRELGVLAGAGGAFGGAGQAVSDMMQGRPGSPGDYAGAVLGGAASALGATRLPTGSVGALAGGATSLAQDVLNGREPSMERAREAAASGNAFTGPLALASRAHVAAQPWRLKGEFGEQLSMLRTRARGGRVEPGPKRRQPLAGGGYTVPDHRTIGGEIVEAKFGHGIRGLSRRQAQAYLQPDLKYRVDHFLPRDAGAAIEIPAGAIGYHTRDRRAR